MPTARSATHRVPKSAARAALFQARGQLSTVIEQCASPELAHFLKHILAQPGRALSETGPALWPRLVVDMALALGGQQRPAAIAAAAVELAVTAIDVADELMDNDWRGDPADRARAQNASVALSFLGSVCVAELTSSLGSERGALIGRLVAEGSFACCDGQDLDVLLERTTTVSEDLAHEMTRRKSGSLLAMACRVGAAVATTTREVLDAAGEFGVHVGVVAQLLNDLNDVSIDPAQRKGDLQQRKKTLPITYALRCAQDEGLNTILAWFADREPRSEAAEQALVVAFQDLGAQHYTWTVAEIHRREALAALAELQRVSQRDQVRSLRGFVPALGPRAVAEAA